MLLALGAVWQWEAKAQDNAPADAQANNALENPAAEDEAPASTPTKSVGMMVVESGFFAMIFYVILGVFSMVALMVALERAVNLRKAKVIPPEFTAELKSLISSGRDTLENFQTLATRTSSPLGRVFHSAVTRAGRPLPEVEKAMEDAVARESAAMRARTKVLGVVGNIAPLVGLLGTVVGMIFAFATASEVGVGKADELAQGIYLALMTTAGGLTIAIPCMLCHAWFNSRVENFMRIIDEILLDTAPSFAKLEVTTAEAVIQADMQKKPQAEAASVG